MYIRTSEKLPKSSIQIRPSGLEYLGQGLGVVPLLTNASKVLTALKLPDSDPNQRERDKILPQTGVSVELFPYRFLTDSHLEAALSANQQSVGAIRQPPEVLLALWAKEGSLSTRFPGVNVPSAIASLMLSGNVSNSLIAQVLVRSFIFWNDLGLDSFVHHPPDAEDNRPTLNDATAVEHARHFASVVQKLIDQKFLPKTFTGDSVTNELSVTSLAPGNFIVKPSVAFYVGALTLMGGLFSSLQAQVFPLLGGQPSVGLNYIQWNMGSGGLWKFLRSADGHRKSAKLPSIEQWALHTKPRKNQWEAVRAHAIRFEFLVKAYAQLFLPPPPLLFAP